MILPLRIDLTKKGEIKPRQEIGNEGYAENIEYVLSVNFKDDNIIIKYFGEDGSCIDLFDKRLVKFLKKHNAIS